MEGEKNIHIIYIPGVQPDFFQGRGGFAEFWHFDKKFC